MSPRIILYPALLSIAMACGGDKDDSGETTGTATGTATGGGGTGDWELTKN